MSTPIRPEPDPDVILADIRRRTGNHTAEPDPDQILAQIRGHGAIDLRQPAESTGVSPRTPASPDQPGNIGDVIASGLTFGAAPKMGAIMHAIAAKGKGLLTGQPTDIDAEYRRELAMNRARLEEGRKTPGSGAIEVAAGLIPTFALPEARATTVLGKILEGAKIGGVMGMLGAEGASDDENPATLLKGGAAGAVGGGALSGLAGIVPKAARGAVDITRTLRKGPEQAGSERALDRLLGRLTMDQMTPEELAARNASASALKAPGTLAHVAGESTDPLTYLAAQSRSPAGANLRRAILTAKRGEGAFVNKGLSQASGLPETVRPDVLERSIAKARATQAAGDYPTAFASPPIRSNTVLETIQGDPVLSDALRNAAKLMQREGIPVKDPTSVNSIVEALRKMGVPDRAIEASGHATEAELPIQLFDYLKRGADVAVARGLKRGDLDAKGAQITMDKVQNLLREVDAQSPAYAKARANYASHSRRLDALDAGRQAWKSTKSADQLIEQLDALATPTERQDFLTGLTGSAQRAVSQRRRGMPVSEGLFDNPDVEAKLRRAYGDEGWNKLKPYLEHGQALTRVQRRTLGGSPTAERTASQEKELNQAATEAAQIIVSPTRAFFNLPGKVFDARERRVNSAMQDKLAEILGIPIGDPRVNDVIAALRQSGGRVTSDVTRTSTPLKLRATGTARGMQLTPEINRRLTNPTMRLSNVLANLLGQASQ